MDILAINCGSSSVKYQLFDWEKKEVIAKGLVDAHGGNIWAESPGLGKGSTFKVVLPFLSTTVLQTMKR